MQVANCTHLINVSSVCVNCKTKIYRNVASSYLNQKAPIISKEITVKETGGNWYNSDIRKAKKVMRKAEKLYHKHGNEFYKNQFRIAKQAKCNLVTAAKCNYYRQKIETCRNDSAKLYGLLNGLLGKSNGENPLPIRSNDLQLANEFSKYFLLKVKGISDMFESFPPSKSQLIPYFPVLPLMSFALRISLLYQLPPVSLTVISLLIIGAFWFK